jgi:hypothetical protein
LTPGLEAAGKPKYAVAKKKRHKRKRVLLLEGPVFGSIRRTAYHNHTSIGYRLHNYKNCKTYTSGANMEITDVLKWIFWIALIGVFLGLFWAFTT